MAGPYASSGWSDLPIDLLIRILRLLELLEALAFRAVCPSWRSASAAAGRVPPCRTPWLVSLAEEPLLSGDQQQPVRRGLWDPTATSELRNLLDAEKTFQIRVVLDKYQEHYVRVDVERLDLKSSQMVGVSPAKALRGHAAFLGQNSLGILSVDKFPEVRTNCIYFTTPRLRGDAFEHCHNQWIGVKVYDLRSRKLEDVFLSGGGHYGTICPSEVWFTPSL
ncbi:uncharacterized protein [Aegilops tauschii subsp. strangulata]|uniref:uncharacterized protein isoform X1 n=1 Tax=Aegilops tauschii subsp. strangulata TaxID=200361 RepID=UPI001E1CA566|nr:uncharacterized protein LOC120968280 isoform X1 [Aegilops tauschii subsp. strangulata]